VRGGGDREEMGATVSIHWTKPRGRNIKIKREREKESERGTGVTVTGNITRKALRYVRVERPGQSGAASNDETVCAVGCPYIRSNPIC
jgi:hypothetical protein